MPPSRAKGAAVGKGVGDAKLRAKGKADQAEDGWGGRTAVGGLKDTLRKACAG